MFQDLEEEFAHLVFVPQPASQCMKLRKGPLRNGTFESSTANSCQCLDEWPESRGAGLEVDSARQRGEQNVLWALLASRLLGFKASWLVASWLPYTLTFKKSALQDHVFRIEFGADRSMEICRLSQGSFVV